MQNGVVCSSEPVAGGVNVFSCTQSDVFTADHLVVMVNGVLGRGFSGKICNWKIVSTPKEGLSVEKSTATISSLVPMNFITVATPHLGSRGNRHVDFEMVYMAYISSVMLFMLLSVGEFEWKRYYLLGHQHESLMRNCGFESEARMLALNYVQAKHPKILNTTRVDCSLYFISPRTMPWHAFILCIF
ncbi:hypothetical protein Hanom_Chr11g00990121 [Helianthus anomalus]